MPNTSVALNDQCFFLNIQMPLDKIVARAILSLDATKAFAKFSIYAVVNDGKMSNLVQIY